MASIPRLPCARWPFALAALFAFVAPAAAQSLTGDWSGHIALPGQELGVVVHLVDEAAGLHGTIDIPAQDAEALPLHAFRRDGQKLEFAIADVPGKPTFLGEVAPDAIAGTFTQGGQKFPFTLARAAAADAKRQQALADVPAWLDATRTMFDVPGCAVAVVKGDAIVATFASGQRDVDAKEAVGPDTLFAIGSSTKAFTTALLAMLVDDGKLDWDQPVRRWLPEFALADAVVGERLTPRDLVTHRSGMPRHDLVWYGATFDRGEMVARLRHLPLNHDLRTDFQYNNLMYLTAGHLAERLGGAPWEDQVRARILLPLGMARTNFAVSAMQRDPDHARAYRKDDGVVKAIPYRDISAIGPAGSINSSVREMAAWVSLQLQHGRLGERKLLSPSTADDLHVVRMPEGSPSRGDDSDVVDVGYALGWFVDVYRGHRRVHHGGNIDGFSALVALLPDAGYGFVVLTNLDGTPLPEVVVRQLSDRVLGLEPRDFRSLVKRRVDAGAEQAKSGEKEAASLRRAGTQPSRALDDYVGSYEHPGYGTVRILRAGDGLRVDLHGLACDLEHWHHDVFACKKGGGEEAMAGTKLQFLLDFDGEIEAVRAVLEASVPPIVFQRGPDPRLRDAKFLAQLAGQYALDSAMATIAVQGERLVLTLPGQRHELEPRRGLTLQLRGLSGYRVEFLLDGDDAPTGLRVHQPEGVFAAKKKS